VAPAGSTRAPGKPGRMAADGGRRITFAGKERNN